MIMSIFYEVRDLYRNRLNEDWKPHLKELEIFDVFAPIYEGQEDVVKANKYVAFIVFATSKDSDYLVSGMDFSENCKDIFKKIGLSEKEDVLLLFFDDKKFVDAAIYILDRLKDRKWKLRIVYLMAAQDFINMGIEKPPTDISYEDKLRLSKNKMDCCNNAADCFERATSLEKELEYEEKQLNAAKYSIGQKSASSFNQMVKKASEKN